MRQNLVRIPFVMMLMLVIGTAALAQNASPGGPQAERVPVKLQIVLSRYNGDRKISSLPYTVSTDAGGKFSLRSGSKAPVVTAMSAAASEGKVASPQVQFLDVGTNMDFAVSLPVNGRFKITVNVSDSSFLENKPIVAGAPDLSMYPIIVNFSITNESSLKDGETKQMVSSPNKQTGEVLKIDVTLTVEK